MTVPLTDWPVSTDTLREWVMRVGSHLSPLTGYNDAWHNLEGTGFITADNKVAPADQTAFWTSGNGDISGKLVYINDTEGPVTLVKAIHGTTIYEMGGHITLEPEDSFMLTITIA